MSAAAGVNDPSVSFAAGSMYEKNCYQHKGKWSLFALLLLLIGIIGLVVVISGFIMTQRFTYKDMYALVIDAGSTSSKVSVFKWKDFLFRTQGYVEQVKRTKIKTPISDFMDNPEQAIPAMRSQLVSLINSSIPEDRRSSSSVYLAATAGMRLEKKDRPKETQRMFQVLREGLSSSFPLRLLNGKRDVRLLSGADEGIYGWITANYVSDNFGQNKETEPVPPEETLGALDLGGASAQITFVTDGRPLPGDVNPEHFSTREYYGQEYSLFSRSFLCLGKARAWNTALARLTVMNAHNFSFGSQDLPHPCLPKGAKRAEDRDNLLKQSCLNDADRDKFPQFRSQQFVGSRDSGLTCAQLVSDLMSRRVFDMATEEWSSSDYVTLQADKQPRPRGKFVAFAGFYHHIKFYKKAAEDVPFTLTKDEYDKATEFICAQDKAAMDKLISESPGKASAKYVYQMCFDFHYVRELLRAYGFEKKYDSITFLKDINGTSLSWALGYAIDVSGLIPHARPGLFVTKGLLAPSLIILVAAIVCAVLLLGMFMYTTHTRRATSPSKRAEEQDAEASEKLNQT